MFILIFTFIIFTYFLNKYVPEGHRYRWTVAFVPIFIAITAFAFFLNHSPKNNTQQKPPTTITENLKKTSDNILHGLGLKAKEPRPQIAQWSCQSCKKRWKIIKYYHIDKIAYAIIISLFAVVLFQIFGLTIMNRTHTKILNIKNAALSSQDARTKTLTTINKIIKRITKIIKNMKETSLLKRIIFSYIYLPKFLYHLIIDTVYILTITRNLNYYNNHKKLKTL